MRVYVPVCVRAPAGRGWGRVACMYVFLHVYSGIHVQLLDTVSNIFGKRRRRGLQDIIGMSKEDKQAACEKLGKPGPVNADLVQSIFNHVDARKDTGSGEWLNVAAITECGYL